MYMCRSVKDYILDLLYIQTIATNNQRVCILSWTQRAEGLFCSVNKATTFDIFIYNIQYILWHDLLLWLVECAKLNETKSLSPHLPWQKVNGEPPEFEGGALRGFAALENFFGGP